MKILWTYLISVTLAVAFAGDAFAYSGESFVTCKLNPKGDNFLALRTCGSSKCEMTRKLGPGTFMLSLEPKAVKGWREVMVVKSLEDESYSGPTGWVSAKYICKIQY
jgi:hypothetical protein